MEEKDILFIQNKFESIFNDSIVKILLKNSHITKIQLETLLIDLLAQKILQKKIIFSDKVNLRIKESKITRGSFTRTLKQSRTNVTKSINTILLLGYLGLFDTPKLQQYIEISNRLHNFLESYRQSINKDINKNFLVLLKQELFSDIQNLMNR